MPATHIVHTLRIALCRVVCRQEPAIIGPIYLYSHRLYGYIVMAYILLADVVMAHMVIVRVVMAYVVMGLCSYGLYSYGLPGCSTGAGDHGHGTQRIHRRPHLGISDHSLAVPYHRARGCRSRS